MTGSCCNNQRSTLPYTMSTFIHDHDENSVGNMVMDDLELLNFEFDDTLGWLNSRPSTPIHAFLSLDGPSDGLFEAGRVLTPSPLASGESRCAPFSDACFRSIDLADYLAVPDLRQDVTPSLQGSVKPRCAPLDDTCLPSTDALTDYWALLDLLQDVSPGPVPERPALDHEIARAAVGSASTYDLSSAMTYDIISPPSQVSPTTYPATTKRKAGKASIFDGLPHSWVLMGRNPRCYRHPGNDRLLKVYKPALQPAYLKARKSEKSAIAQLMADKIYGEGGKFVKYDKRKGAWLDVPVKTAREKCAQALREQLTPEKRKEKRGKYPKKRKGGSSLTAPCKPSAQRANRDK